MPLYTEECGERYCTAAKLVKAASVRRGDRLYVSDGTHSSAKVSVKGGRGVRNRRRQEEVVVKMVNVIMSARWEARRI